MNQENSSARLLTVRVQQILVTSKFLLDSQHCSACEFQTVNHNYAKNVILKIPNIYFQVLGSGGHTTEILKLVKTLDKDKYYPRFYLHAKTDEMSKKKLCSLNDNPIVRKPVNSILLQLNIKL